MFPITQIFPKLSSCLRSIWKCLINDDHSGEHLVKDGKRANAVRRLALSYATAFDRGNVVAIMTVDCCINHWDCVVLSALSRWSSRWLNPFPNFPCKFIQTKFEYRVKDVSVPVLTKQKVTGGCCIAFVSSLADDHTNASTHISHSIEKLLWAARVWQQKANKNRRLEVNRSEIDSFGAICTFTWKLLNLMCQSETRVFPEAFLFGRSLLFAIESKRRRKLYAARSRGLDNNSNASWFRARVLRENHCTMIWFDSFARALFHCHGFEARFWNLFLVNSSSRQSWFAFISVGMISFQCWARYRHHLDALWLFISIEFPANMIIVALSRDGICFSRPTLRLWIAMPNAE